MTESAPTNLAVVAIQEYRLVIAVDYGTTYTGPPSRSLEFCHLLNLL
jgi:hypothetical protein